MLPEVEKFSTSGSIFFEKISFLDPNLFGPTRRIFDDTIFFGSDDPPYYICFILVF